MATGEYEVDETDLPLKQIYQCDSGNLTKLCIRDLEAGETNGRLVTNLPLAETEGDRRKQPGP